MNNLSSMAKICVKHNKNDSNNIGETKKKNQFN